MTSDHEEAPSLAVTPAVSRRDWAWVAGVVVVLGALYAWQLQPGIAPHGDISKFQFAGPLGGTVHQTGYPIYLILSRLAAGALPFVDAATVTTALSAVFALGTAAMTYVAIRELRARPLIAATFSLLLGVAPIVFYYAVVAEVYTAHLFFTAAVLAMLLRWRRTGSDVDLGAAIALFALSFGNHMTTALLVPGVLWFVWQVDRATFRRAGVWLFGLASLLLTVGSYGYLIWRAGDPTTPFLEVAPESWLHLPAIWMGSGGSSLFLGPGQAGEIVGRLPGVAGDVARYALVAIPLAAVGLRALWRDPAGAMLAWWGLASLAFALVFATPDPQILIPPLVFVLMVAAAVGAEWLFARYVSSVAILAVMLAVVAAVSVADGARFVDLQSGDEYEQRMRGWFSEIPPDGVLAASYTDAMAAFYITLLEEERTDIDVISDYPLADPEASVIGMYLGGESVEVPHTRAQLTPGRAVYAPGREWACDLVGAGFVVERFSDGLFQVVALTDPTAAASAVSVGADEVCDPQ